MKYIKTIFALLLMVLSISCGGGGGGSSNTTQENINPSGIYLGTISQNKVVYDVLAVIYNNRLVAVNLDIPNNYTSDISVNGNKITGLLSVISDGVFNHNTTLSLTVTDDSMIGSTSDFFDLSFKLLPVYNRIPYINLAGIYNQVIDTYTSSMSISNDGTIYGSDTDGCVYNGTQTSIDDKHNLYELTLYVSNCGDFDITFKGYSFNLDTDALVIILDDPNAVGMVYFLKN